MPPQAARPDQLHASLQDAIFRHQTVRSVDQLLPGAMNQTRDSLIGPGPFEPFCECFGCLCTEA